MSPAPQAVAELVERFRHNVDYYHCADYNETQVRREFIDPFFTALGWDVANRTGAAPRYQDVEHEASVALGQGAAATLGAPDYCFRIGGTPVFYVEAKKPAVDIRDDIHPAYQLRRYAWSAKLPVSILTDFEEFSIYEGRRVRPQPTDGPATARVLYVTYDEYETRWDEIAAVCSKQAVLRGDLERFAETSHGKRGTQEVDDVFLGQMEAWRETLARNLALRNPALGARDLAWAVQQTLDRLIFLRICEDRGIEPYEQLRHAAEARSATGAEKGAIYARLLEIFRAADQVYNSGLFHLTREPGRENADTLTPTLTIDDRVLADILGDLYYPRSPYAFDAVGADILGSVYERFLGSVIRLTPGHQAKVEQKPEVRKAGGVYYTPTYIVDYIVKHTVGALCENKTPGEVAKLRILDPACGSGSFLLGAYQYLLDWHLQWYLDHPTQHARREVYQGRNGEWFLTAEEKRRILTSNLYGVDIDPQAVEVTKLSLMLKVLEDENREGLAQQLAFLRQRALPDLERNIQCGNSLIEPDYFEGRQLGLLDDEAWQRVNPFDWSERFKGIIKSGGFDAVIGNPPYIRIQTMKEWAPLEVELYKQRYVSASKGNYDIYVVFVEKGLSLLNRSGRLGYILPHKFFNAQYGEPLRRLISDGRYLSHVVHFGDQQVFAGATTYTCLLFLDKAGSEAVDVHKVTDLAAWRAERAATTGALPAAHITAGEWNLVVGPGAGLFERLREMPFTLGQVSAKVFQGLVTGADPVYVMPLLGQDKDQVRVLSKALGEQVVLEGAMTRPLLKGAEIRRYHVEKAENVVLYPYHVKSGSAHLLTELELRHDYPLCWSYLKRARTALEAREGGMWKVPQWWQFGRNQNIAEMGNRKLLTQVLASRGSYTADLAATYCFVGGGNAGGYGITVLPACGLSDLYVLGLLNTHLLDVFLRSVSTPFRGGYYSYARRFIEQLPIRTIDFSSPADVARHDQLVALVERMLALHERARGYSRGADASTLAHTPHDKTLLQRQIDATDREIDRLVYALYDLTPEEIAIVEDDSTR